MKITQSCNVKESEKDIVDLPRDLDPQQNLFILVYCLKSENNLFFCDFSPDKYLVSSKLGE